MGRSPSQIIKQGTSYFSGPSPTLASDNLHVNQSDSSTQLSAGGSWGPNRVLPTFDGVGDVDLFFKRFEFCTESSNWSEGETLSRLLTDSLQGKATEMLQCLPADFQMNYANIKYKLFSFFASKHDRDYYVKQLEGITRNNGELLQDFCNRVSLLANKAYHFPSTDMHKNGIKALINGCNSHYASLAMLSRDLSGKTIEEASEILHDVVERTSRFSEKDDSLHLRALRSHNPYDSDRHSSRLLPFTGTGDPLVAGHMIMYPVTPVLVVIIRDCLPLTGTNDFLILNLIVIRLLTTAGRVLLITEIRTFPAASRMTIINITGTLLMTILLVVFLNLRIIILLVATHRVLNVKTIGTGGIGTANHGLRLILQVMVITRPNTPLVRVTARGMTETEIVPKAVMPVAVMIILLKTVLLLQNLLLIINVVLIVTALIILLKIVLINHQGLGHLHLLIKIIIMYILRIKALKRAQHNNYMVQVLMFLPVICVEMIYVHPRPVMVSMAHIVMMICIVSHLLTVSILVFLSLNIILYLNFPSLHCSGSLRYRFE